MEQFNEEEVYELLFKGIKWAGYTSPRAAELIRAHADKFEIKKKGIVLEKGNVCRYCYFVISGILRAYFEEDGRDVTSWIMDAGNVAIGVSSFYSQTASVEFIEALEDTICIRLSFEDLEMIYGECVDFNVVGRHLTEKYHTLFTMQASLVVYKAKERYLKFMELFPNLDKLVKEGRVPQKHIASLLGMTESYLSQILTNLRDL